ncbi:MAG: M23 family metallopeptidase [Defluviitaleaceae bacterium]|nr:M23 family metallopeptidase [Defluviitaleaceae bacterium]
MIKRVLSATFAFLMLIFLLLTGQLEVYASDEAWLWPVPDNRTVSSPFGMRNGRLHGGIDISSSRRLNVVASRSGTVITASDRCTCNPSTSCNCGGGWGNFVVIRHSGGYESVYAHLEHGSIMVSRNQYISQGDLIGITGASGRTTFRHLHFEIRLNGTRINSNPYDNTHIRGSSGISNSSITAAHNSQRGIHYVIEMRPLVQDFTPIHPAQQRQTSRANAPIRRTPYGTGTEIRPASATVMVTGYGTNTTANANRWYSVQGGGWIYSGNLVPADFVGPVTPHVIDPSTQIQNFAPIQPAQQRQTRSANSPIRSVPYSTGIQDRPPAGATVWVTGHGTNTTANANRWYSVQGGGWIYSGNLAPLAQPTPTPTPSHTPTPTNITPIENTRLYITNSNTPVRMRHYASDPTRAYMQIGEPVTANARVYNTQGNRWYRVANVAGITGYSWIFSGNLSRTNPTTPIASTRLYITNSNTPVRRNHYASYPTIAYAQIGDAVIATARVYNTQGNRWYRVLGVDGANGYTWIFSGNLSRTNPTPTPTPTPIPTPTPTPTPSPTPTLPSVTPIANTRLYIINSNTPVRRNHYATDPTIAYMQRGEAVTANAMIYNTQGNRWYRVSNAAGISGYTWIFSGNLSRTNPTTPIASTRLYITNSNTPVRRNHYASYPTIASLQIGDAVTATARVYNTQGNRWYRVSGVAGVSGYTWIFSGNLSHTNPRPAPTGTRMYITRDNVPIRAAFYARYPTLRSVNLGTAVMTDGYIINSQGNRWYRVTSFPYNGGITWIYSGNLSRTNPRSS